MLKFLAKLLIVLSIPASIFWYPIANVPGAGNLSISDLTLILLWLITFYNYRFTEIRTNVDRYPLKIVLLVLLLGCLTSLGAFASGGQVGPLQEFGVFMKRFGLASILPLAMFTFSSKRVLRSIKIVLFLCIAALLLFSLFPDLRSILPLTSLNLDTDSTVLGERATGLISNPNDLAYLSVLGLAGFICLMRIDKIVGLKLKIIMLLSIIFSLACTVLSGSRSGVLGLLAGVMFIVLKRNTSIKIKVGLFIVLAIAGSVGWQMSSEFQTRVERVYIHQLGEDNISSRLQAQSVAVLASLENPLGVGYGNFKEATRELSHGMVFSYVEGSDSAYFDTLLGAGFLGLVVLILIFYKCMQYVKYTEHKNIDASIILQASCIAVFIFGTATVVPISVFISPIFFFVVGCSAYVNSYSSNESI